jgi:uncharacterized MAPEG superfamily protein
VTTELQMLTWSVVLTLIQVVVTVLLATRQVGLPALAGNREGMAELSGMAGRSARAHRNMLENLVLFAALALTVVVTDRSNTLSAAGAQLFFWGRVAYFLVYTAGLPWIRTATWGVSVAGLVVMLLQLIP